jgi:hypothetical protein
MTARMASPSTPAHPVLAVTISRQWPIPACSLTLDDLRRLFGVLKHKASEAATEQLAHIRTSAGTSVDAKVLEEARNLMGLTLQIRAANGEWSSANSAAPLSDDSAPAVLTSVTYDCGAQYKGRFSLFPQNLFSVTIDFTRTRLGDLSNLALSEGLGSSFVNLSGVNSTWVNAVDLELRTFFKERGTRRGWLHSRFAYDLALMLIGVPLCLDGIYLLDKRLATLITLPSAVFVALYVYFMLVGLYMFRLVFNYAKWVFPKIEGPPQRNSSATFHKVVLGALGLGLLDRVVETILWLAGIHLH